MGERAASKFVEGQEPAAIATTQTELALSDLVRELNTGKHDAGIYE
jgi:hypothetical protein